MDDENLTDEDLKLWYYVSRSVTPMPGKEDSINQPEEHFTEPATRQNVSEEDLKKLISKDDKKEQRKTQLGYLHHGDIKGVDKSTAKRLTGGKFKPEATLDLHGHTQDAALEELRYFMRNAFEVGKRRVLVITGKGKNNDGILKNQVPRWFNVSGIREYILMFSHAKPNHGGEGALYVLLKKRN